MTNNLVGEVKENKNDLKVLTFQKESLREIRRSNTTCHWTPRMRKIRIQEIRRFVTWLW